MAPDDLHQVDSTAARSVPSGQPFLPTPPKPEKLAVGTVLTIFEIATKLGVPALQATVPLFRGSGEKSTASALLRMREAEIRAEALDKEIAAIMADQAVSDRIKWALRDLTRQLTAALNIMDLAADVLDGKDDDVPGGGK